MIYVAMYRGWDPYPVKASYDLDKLVEWAETEGESVVVIEEVEVI